MEKIKIAIVDDHELFRSGLKTLLNGHDGFEVVFEASSGLDLTKNWNSLEADVILLDIEMPEMNGSQTLDWIQKNRRQEKVLMLTMYEQPQFIVDFLSQGANGYLLKDSAQDLVFEAIEKVHQTGQFLTPKVSEVLLGQLTNPTDSSEKLGERELEVLQLICQEYTTAEIADKLFLSARTIETYRKRLLEKTGARNTAGLVKYALEHKLV